MTAFYTPQREGFPISEAEPVMGEGVVNPALGQLIRLLHKPGHRIGSGADVQHATNRAYTSSPRPMESYGRGDPSSPDEAHDDAHHKHKKHKHDRKGRNRGAPWWGKGATGGESAPNLLKDLPAPTQPATTGETASTGTSPLLIFGGLAIVAIVGYLWWRKHHGKPAPSTARDHSSSPPPEA